MTQFRDPSTPVPSTADVRHYVPGGREAGGGIGRLVGYILDAQPPGHGHAICDTRGPAWRPARSVLHLAAAAGGLVASRLAAPGRVHHFHVAGRGSTARKLVLTALARGLGCRHVLHLHDYDYARDVLRRPAWQRAAIGRMFRGADEVIVLGRRDRDTATGLLGVPESRVRILRNCVPDPGPLPPAAGPDGPVGIVFLGRLGPRKGVPELIDALARPEMQALAVRPGWRAALAGDGPVESYRAQAEALGLASRVTLPGWLDEAATRALRRQARILVLPSHDEGMAMAVLEGLAQGLAVVTTRVGAHDEVMTDGLDCAFVPVGDPQALAETLARLVADPQERARLGRGGRALFERGFGIESYVRRLDRLYAGLSGVEQIGLDPA